ncbi:MAG: type II secretion system F family protein [Alphaproteobacteria bacterium]
MSAVDILTGMLDGDASGPLLFALCGLSFVLLLVGAHRLLAARTTTRRRLTGEAAVVAGPSVSERGPSLRADYQRSPLARALARLGQRMAGNSKASASLRRRLLHAGFAGSSAIAVYQATRVIVTVGLPAVALLVVPMIAPDFASKHLPILLGALGLFGFFLPSLVVGRIVSSRQTVARAGFPDALDTLLVCVEAGLGLDAAVNRVAVEIGNAYPLLGDQFTLVAAELRTGQSRETALRNLAERLNIDEANALATLLVQSEHLGTSVSQTLRVLADDFRQKRMLRAEERANVLPVKLAFPLVLFILPSLMVVIMGPTVIRILHTLGPTMSGNG